MMFGNKKKPNDCIKPQIKNHSISEVPSAKFLGVTLDNKLSWKEHISVTENKLAKVVGVMAKLRDKLDRRALKLIYSALALPHLIYCCEIWGNTCNTYLSKIILLQKKAIRIISELGYRDSTCKSFQELNLLKFNDIVYHRSCLFAYRGHKKLLPVKLQKRWCDVSEIHHHNTKNSRKLFKKVCRTTIKSRCLSVKGASDYNSLPEKIKNCKTIDSFKKNLKKFIVNKY